MSLTPSPETGNGVQARVRGYTLRQTRRTAHIVQMLPRHRLFVVIKTPVMVLLGMYLAGGTFQFRTVGLTMLLGAAFWASLYALNEATDLECEKRYQVSQRAKTVLYTLPVLCCLGAILLSSRLLLPFGLMLIGQIAYCVPPLRLKRYWWAILLLSGTLNPLMRLQCGIVWGSHGLSALMYAAFVLSHLGSALKARVTLRERDKRLGYTTAPKGAEYVGMACSALGLSGAAVLIWQGVLPPVFRVFLVLCAGFAVYAWSGRVTSMAKLRQGWILFAVCALLGIVALLMQR